MQRNPLHPRRGVALAHGRPRKVPPQSSTIKGRARRGVGGDRVLNGCQTLRQGDNLLMLVLTDHLDRLFSNDSRLPRAG